MADPMLQPRPDAQPGTDPNPMEAVVEQIHTAIRAEPILASQLLASRVRGPEKDEKGAGERVKIGDGENDLDEYVLLGGVERGEVVGISGAVEEGVGRLMSLHLVSTLLISHTMAHASIIDTAGSFPLALLASIFRHRIVHSLPSPGSRLPTNSVMREAMVKDMLARVSISRVFDLEGVCEVVGEISGELRNFERELEEQDQKIKEKGTKRERRKESNKEFEIEDSEAEDDDEEEYAGEDDDVGVREKGRTEILLIDNVTGVISGLFGMREKGAAHTLLSALSRTLHSLSQQHNTLTILLNDIRTVKEYASNHNSENPNQHSNLRGLNYYPNANPNTNKNPTSVFAGTTARPALGRLFSDMITLHLFISSIPLRQRDAEILYNSSHNQDAHIDDGNEPQPGANALKTPGQKRKERPEEPQYAHVLEILKDETSELNAWTLNPETDGVQRKVGAEGKKRRDQRWGAFVVAADGVTLNDPFAKPGAGEGGAEVDVLKQFPFGRRP